MEKSKVYFTNLRTKFGNNLLVKLRNLATAAGMKDIDFAGRYTAIKLHLGEPGNLGYLRPNYTKVLVDMIKEQGGWVFLTDCNTLYTGRRKNAVDHLEAAFENGFSPFSTGCPIIIGDGLKGNDDVEVPVKNGELVQKAKIGRALMDADIVISLTHFKGHESTGFGGTLKNLGMGGGSIPGKMDMHCEGKPKIKTAKCRSCRACIMDCGQDAITMDQDNKAFIHQDICVGCGRCISACPFGAVQVPWDESNSVLSKKIAEYAQAVVQDRPCFHISLMVDISPACDCMSHNDMPIIPDVGFFASFDPVALDKACVDKAKGQPVIPGSALDRKLAKEETAGGKGHKGIGDQDVFTFCHPDTDWLSGLEHGEKIGLGSMDYELIEID